MQTLSSIQDKRYKYGDIGASIKDIIDNDLKYARFMYEKGHWILEVYARDYLFGAIRKQKGFRSVGVRKHY